MSRSDSTNWRAPPASTSVWRQDCYPYPDMGFYWAERTADNRRRAYPKYKAARPIDTVETVVIGGGLTGCAAAYALAASGRKVVLLEAERLAGGGTAMSLGMIASEPDAAFRAVDAYRGRRVARPAWEAAQHGAVDLTAALGKAGVNCDLHAAALHVNAFGFEQAEGLKREQTARKDAALDAAWLSAPVAKKAISTESYGAIRLRGGAVYDPVRAALGFAAAAEKNGAQIFEHTPVTKTTFTRRDATVYLANGAKLLTKEIVVATGRPGALFRSLERHVRVTDGHVVVTQPLNAEMRREAGSRGYGLIERNGESARFLRFLADDRVLFAGAQTRVQPAKQADKVLVQHAGQLMYELSLHYPSISGLRAEWAWRVPVVSTLDGLPWVGAHRNFPFHFFAIALGWHGDAISYFAARSAVRHFDGEARKGDDAYTFLRVL